MSVRIASPVVVVRQRAATSVDPYSGATGADWTLPPVATNLDVYAVAPAATGETIEANRAPVRVELDVYAPPGIDLTTEDRVAYGGQVYRVLGEPQRWRSPYVGADGTQWSAVVFKLGRVEG